MIGHKIVYKRWLLFNNNNYELQNFQKILQKKLKWEIDDDDLHIKEPFLAG